MGAKAVEVTAIWLVRAGDHMLVKAEVNGRWVTVIDEFDPHIPDVSPPHSHIVEGHGIEAAAQQAEA